jgi:hypothetical protein
VRIAARQPSKERVRELHPEIKNKNQQQMRAYSELPDSDRLAKNGCRLQVARKEFPGYKGARIACAEPEKPLLSASSRDNSGTSNCYSAELRLLACTVSTACPTLKIVASSKCFPRICIPIGKPDRDSAHGTETPQMPARFAVTV